MPSVSTVAEVGALILIVGFFAVVFWKLLTGEISLDQLFEGDIRDKDSAEGFSSYSSAGRVQSFLITLFVSLYYLVQFVHNPGVFPVVSNEFVGIVAASQGLYLAGKAQAMLLGPLRDLLR